MLGKFLVSSFHCGVGNLYFNGPSGYLHKKQVEWDCVGKTGITEEVCIFIPLFYSLKFILKMVYI